MDAVATTELGVKKTETQQQFLSREFPLLPGESHVKYCLVGVNRFRVNFYTEQETDGPSFVKGFIIKRHYYVILEQNGTSWKILQALDN